MKDKHGWTSIEKDGLPQFTGDYLTYHKNGSMRVNFFINSGYGKAHFMGTDNHKITHWKETPKPPEGV